MDANGTSFHLLLGERDWGACTDERGRPLWSGELPSTEWLGDLHELTLRRLPFVFPTPQHDREPSPRDRRGAAADRFANVYWLDEPATGVLVRSSGSGRTTRFWSSEDGVAAAAARGGGFGPAEPPVHRALPLAGLAVTDDHRLVAGVTRPAGLLVFDLVAGGEPTFSPWPALAFEPLDVAAREGGGLWVLDAANRRVWELERDLRIVTVPAPAPAPGGFIPGPRTTVRAEDAFAIEAGAVAIAAFGGGALVLYADRLALHTERARPPLTAATAGRGVATRGHDMTVSGGVAYVADSHGNQAFAFALSVDDAGLHAELRPVYYPLRLFGGKGLVSGPRGVLYDFTDGWIPLVHQPRAQHVDAAVVVTPALDGGEPGCVWHRLFLDGRLEPGSRVRVWSAAADEPAALEQPDWRPEPDPLRRAGGIELPFADALDGYDTYELLFQTARGRHLRVKLELSGDGRATPRLRALRASFPRFSYLERYLPAVYREDPASASFLDRFLANVEGLFTSIEDMVAAAPVLFDPAGAPDDALEWLAGWFDAALDPAWDDATRRLFVRHAMDIFRRRGTLRGLELALQLGLNGALDEDEILAGPPPGAARARIVEAFRSRHTPGVLWGDPTDLGEPRVVAADAWTPPLGAVALNAAYGGPFPLTRPEGEAGDAWQAFAERTLGFVPAPATAPVVRAWRAFLSRRYPNSAAYSAAYGLTGAGVLTDFDDALPPAELPPDGPPLQDWFAFGSVVLPMRRRAHRFTVLLPATGDEDAAYELRGRAERIVALAKPAHTIFDVRFFWAAFRLGEARLGEDTLISLGSRAPELLGPAVLGRRALGESYLGGQPASDRIRREEPS